VVGLRGGGGEKAWREDGSSERGSSLCIVSRPRLDEVESCTITFIQHKFYATINIKGKIHGAIHHHPSAAIFYRNIIIERGRR
jgi:hypothetical protein